MKLTLVQKLRRFSWVNILMGKYFSDLQNRISLTVENWNVLK